MASSISLAWAGCHVRVTGGGWSALYGVPEQHCSGAAARLLALGASSATVVQPGVIRFRAGASVCSHLVAVFPSCPLA